MGTISGTRTKESTKKHQPLPVHSLHQDRRLATHQREGVPVLGRGTQEPLDARRVDRLRQAQPADPGGLDADQQVLVEHEGAQNLRVTTIETQEIPLVDREHGYQPGGVLAW